MSPPASPGPADYHAFLLQHWPAQPGNVVRHTLAGQTLWIKRAGARHGVWRYRLLGAAAQLLGLSLLTPVPNPGGRAAIATEVQRLRTLAEQGLRVPQVLASCEDAFLMSDLGQPGQPAQSLLDAMQAAGGKSSAALLKLWCQGLDTLDLVHSRGQCLSQAFARNMVLCPDGVIGCIDFEDDPGATLPMLLCQQRDALAYVHSSAWLLQQAGVQAHARSYWQQQWLGQRQRSGEFAQALQASVQRLAALRHLPQDQRWGRDAQRLRAAYDLLKT